MIIKIIFFAFGLLKMSTNKQTKVIDKRLKISLRIFVVYFHQLQGVYANTKQIMAQWLESQFLDTQIL
jgi:hypothetical protein